MSSSISAGSLPSFVDVNAPIGFTDPHNKAGAEGCLSSRPATQEVPNARNNNLQAFSGCLQKLLENSRDGKIVSFTVPNFHRIRLNFRIPQIHPTRISFPSFCFSPSNKPWFLKVLALPFLPFKKLQLIVDFRAKSNAFWFSRNTHLALQKTLEAGQAISFQDAKGELNRVMESLQGEISGLAEKYSHEEWASSGSLVKKIIANVGVFCRNRIKDFHSHKPWGQYVRLRREGHLGNAVLKELWGLEVNRSSNVGSNENLGEQDQVDNNLTLTQVKHAYWKGHADRLNGFLSCLDVKGASILKRFSVLFIKCTVVYWFVKLAEKILDDHVQKLNQRIDKHKRPSTYQSDLVQPDGVKNHRRTLAHQAELLDRAALVSNVEVDNLIRKDYTLLVDAVGAQNKINLLQSKINYLNSLCALLEGPASGNGEGSVVDNLGFVDKICLGFMEKLFVCLPNWIRGKIVVRYKAKLGKLNNKLHGLTNNFNVIHDEVNRINSKLKNPINFSQGLGGASSKLKNNVPRELADFYYDEFFDAVSSYSGSLSSSGHDDNPSADSSEKLRLKQISALILASLEGKSLRRNMREWVCILKNASKQSDSGLSQDDIKAIRDLHNKLVNKHAYDITKISQVFFHCGYGLRAQDKQRMYTDAIPEIVRLMKVVEGKEQSISSGLMRYNLDVPNFLLELLSVREVSSITENDLNRLQTPQARAFFELISKEVRQRQKLFDGEFDSQSMRVAKGKATVADLKSIVARLKHSFSNQGDESVNQTGQDLVKKLVLDNKDIFFETSAMDFLQRESFGLSKLFTKNENRRYKNAEFMSKVLGLNPGSTMANYRRAQHAILKHGNAWIQTSAKTSSNLGMAYAVISNLAPYAVMIFNKPLGLMLIKFGIPVATDSAAYVAGAGAGLLDLTLPLLAAGAKRKRIQELKNDFPQPQPQLQGTIAEQYDALANSSVSANQPTTQPAVRSFWTEFKQCHGAAHKASFKTIYQGAAETLQWAYSVALRSLAEKASGKNEALVFEDLATRYLSGVHNRLLKGRFLFAAKSKAELDSEVLECLKVMTYSLSKAVVVVGGGTMAAALGLVAWLGKLLGSAVIKTWSPKLPISDETMSDGFAVKQPGLSNLESLDFEDFKRNLWLIIKDIFNNPVGLFKYLPNVVANITACAVALLDFLFDKMARINPPDVASVKALAAVDNSSSPSSSSAEVGSSSAASGASPSPRLVTLSMSEPMVIASQSP